MQIEKEGRERRKEGRKEEKTRGKEGTKEEGEN